MNNGPIIKEVVINAPASRIWSALTTKEEIKKWSFDIPEFNAEPGFEFRFWGGDENRQWLHICRVKDVIKNRKLSYSWRYDNIPGETLVTFKIFEEGENCRVKLTHTGVENFPSDIPELARENFVKGWDEIIGSLLKNYVENN